MKKFQTVVFCALIFYLVLPIVIFLLGWVKPVFSIPAVIVIGLSSYRILRDRSACPAHQALGKRQVKVYVAAFLIISLWVYFSGVGGFAFQNWDHETRNGLFNMLVNNDWPVVITPSSGDNHPAYLLVYYIAFWLPSAIVGKIFGIGVGYYFQALWSVIGIWFFYYLVLCYLKKVSLFPLIIFIFFSGLDVIGTAIVAGSEVSIFAPEPLARWCPAGQFSSFTAQLFWVFNQAIPGWLLTILVLLQKKNKYVVFYMGISLLACPFPCVGAVPFFVYVVLRNARKFGSFKKTVRDLCSFENIFGGGVSGLITCLYLKSNNSGGHLAFLPAEVNGTRFFIFCVVVLIILEVAVYAIVIYKYQNRNPLFYVAVAFLCTCPLIQVGNSIDYCMRASIPAQVVLYLLVVDTLYVTFKKKDMLTVVFLTIILLIGSITPIHDINRSIQNTINGYKNGEQILATATPEEELMTGEYGNNYKGDAENSFFYKFLAR